MNGDRRDDHEDGTHNPRSSNQSRPTGLLANLPINSNRLRARLAPCFDSQRDSSPCECRIWVIMAVAAEDVTL
jgi:hypothetical protein